MSARPVFLSSDDPYMVAPSLRVSAAVLFSKIIERIDDFPDPASDQSAISGAGVWTDPNGP